MSTPNNPLQARDAGNWAKPIAKLQTSDIPAGALNINVDGKPLTGPIRGFGQMWQKTFRARLDRASRSRRRPSSPTGNRTSPVIWPKGNTLYVPTAGIVPGETAVINTTLPGNILVMATGVRVIYADDESFAYMTPAGHPFNGMITFSAAALMTAQPLRKFNCSCALTIRCTSWAFGCACSASRKMRSGAAR